MANNARRLRLERGWSLVEAGKRCGISHQLLSMIEKGERPNPTLETLRAMAAAYDVTIDELAGEENSTPPELQRLIDSGVMGEIDLGTLRKLKRARGLLGVEPTPQDYIVLLGMIRRGQ